ncbi:hypothetical protein CANMA_003237 [Candida margitis]|uniref:uncharacterized protein n=1 Tax=Candida margitis TaxID=1775924 RepID=UPI0022265842|nr:uncharacterized protein CANMA_003237 [Candida margitis]KAI5967180.1 hypothetical protein CANMA_003237 [Candida margitis]
MGGPTLNSLLTSGQHSFVPKSITIASLPYDVLQEIFNHTNQHQALALAPMHSNLQDVIKRKSYKNIYVYRSRKRCTDHDGRFASAVSGISLHHPKNINNRKGNMHTIISLDTLERYLARMDAQQEIYLLELIDHHLVIDECILRHFRHLRYLKLGNSCSFCYDDYPWELFSSIARYIKCLDVTTILISNVLGTGELEVDTYIVTERKLHYLDEEEPSRLVGQISNLSTLYITEIDTIRNMSFSLDLNLRKLCLCQGSITGGKFSISSALNTSDLQELYILGSIGIETTGFDAENLEQEFPKLLQLGLDPTNYLYFVFSMHASRNRVHNVLKSLVMSQSSVGPDTSKLQSP